jgi:hypothetical protein
MKESEMKIKSMIIKGTINQQGTNIKQTMAGRRGKGERTQKREEQAKYPRERVSK